MLFILLSGLKLFSYVSLINIYETEWCHNTEYHYLNFLCSVDLVIYEYIHLSCNILQDHAKPDVISPHVLNNYF
jgi:hypothetical protein